MKVNSCVRCFINIHINKPSVNIVVHMEAVGSYLRLRVKAGD